MTIEPVSDPTDPADRSEALDLLTDTTARLDALRQRLVTGKTVPMSASIMVNKKETLAEVDELRTVVAAAFAQAAAVKEAEDAILAAARVRAAEVVAQARAEAAELVSAESVHRRAAVQASELAQDASQEIGESRAQLDDYVDRKLAHLEVLLTRTLSQVTEGRRQIGDPSHAPNLDSRSALGALAEDRHDDPPDVDVVRGDR
jgi:hypothetical protein